MAFTKRVYSTTKKVFIYGSGTLGMFLILLASLYYLGIQVETSGDLICNGNLENPCISYFNISLSNYSLCFGSTFKGIYFDKNVTSNILKADLRYRSDNPLRWKPYNFTSGKCLERGKKHEFKIMGYKNPSETVKWSLDLQGKDIDPYWYSKNDFYKNYDSKNKEYSIYSVANDISPLAKVQLLYNTDSCLENCYADLKMTLNVDLTGDVAFTDMLFYDVGKNFKRNNLSSAILYRTTNYTIKVDDFKEICREVIKANGTAEICSWEKSGFHEKTRWNYKPLPSELKSGIYYLRLEAEKNPEETIEWQLEFQDLILDEWATWTSSYETGLISYHKFEENLVDLINQSYNFTDTGNGNSIEYINGKNGSAVLINSSAATSDTLKFNYDYWESLNRSGFVSVSFWANINDTNKCAGAEGAGGTITLLERGSGSPDYQRYFYLTFYCDSNLTNIGWYRGGYSPVFTSTGTTTLNRNTWYHMFLEMNTSYIRYFINNQSELTGNALDTSTVIFDNNYLYPSRLFYGITADYRPVINGSIDEMAIWNRSLSDNERADLYDSGNGIFLMTSPDNTYPSFSSYWDNNATIYDAGYGLFNVTVLDTNGTVILWINGTSILATNLTAYVYNVSFYLSNGTYMYNWSSYGNGTDHNLGWSDNRSYTVKLTDTIYPIFFSYWDDNDTINDTGLAHFNVSINNTNGLVYLDINGQNRTASNTSYYNYNVSLFLTTNIYPYYWNSHGNGTDALYNISSLRSYTVGTSVTNINLTLDGLSANLTAELGTKINITANSSGSGGAICIDIDHPSYNINYICNSNISILFNVSYFRNNQFNDGSTTKNISWISGNPFCYQETANVSTSCGGLNTGSYTFSNNGGSETQIQTYFNINYSKPQNADNNSLWVINHGLLSNYSINIPNYCWNYDQDTLILRIVSENNISVPHSRSYPQCFNGSWNTIGITSLIGACCFVQSGNEFPYFLYDGDWSTYSLGSRYGTWLNSTSNPSVEYVYEEAMNWKMSLFFIQQHQYDEIVNASINISGHISDGTYPKNVKIYINNSLSNDLGLVYSGNIILNTLNDSSTIKNLTFSGYETKIVYLKIPKTALVSDAYMNLSGFFNRNFEGYTDSFSNVSSRNPYYGYFNQTNMTVGSPFFWMSPLNDSEITGWINSSNRVIRGSEYNVRFNITKEFNITVPQNISYIYTNTTIWGDDSFKSTSELIYLFNFTSSIWISQPIVQIPLNAPDCMILENKINITSDYIFNNNISIRLVKYFTEATGQKTIISAGSQTCDGFSVPQSDNNQLELLKFNIKYGYYSYPTNVSLEVGIIDGIPEWNYTGVFKVTNNKTSNFNTFISTALASCIPDSDSYCTIPLYHTSKTSGIIQVSDIQINYSSNPNPVYLNTNLISSFLGNSSGFTNIPIKFESSQNGTLTINDIRLDYAGGNKTYKILAHNYGYTINKSYYVTYYYSKWGYKFPRFINYLEFIPATPSSKNVTPYGQIGTIPILNITTYNYGSKNANMFIYLNETHSCVDLYASSNNTKPISTLWDSLIGYWPFDVDARDISKDNNGTIVGAVFNGSGQLGGAYTFDGSNDYVNISSLIFNYSSGSISIWFNPRHATNDQIIVYSGNGGDGWGLENETGIAFGRNTQTFSGFVDGAPGCEIEGTSAISLNNWHFGSLVWNTTNLSLYIDGTMNKSMGCNQSQNIGSYNSSFIGRPEISSRYANGTIDEVRIYNRTLTSSEISNLYTRSYNKYYDTKLKNTWTVTNWDAEYLNNSKIWLWADYSCNYTSWQLWNPDLYFRNCAFEATCSEDLV